MLGNQKDVLDEQESTDKGIIGNIKAFKKKYENSRDTISKTSTILKESVYKNIHKKTEETSERINEVLNKNSKLHNLERMLFLDKTHLVSSDKDASFYKPAFKKIVIFENDRLGDVEYVTIKEDFKIALYVVKYVKYKPFIYPSFSDNKIPGETYYLDENEIWYRKDNLLTVCYKKNSSMAFDSVDLLDFKDLAEEDIITVIKTYNFIHRSTRLTQFVMENNIDIKGIIRVTEKYIILKDENNSFIIYLYDKMQGSFTKMLLSRLPNIELSSFDTILTPEMTQFIAENNYQIELFEEHNGFIEYNKVIDNRKICMFRIKI